MFIDSHCHLDRLDLSVYQGNLDLAIEAAREAGVDRMLCISIDLENSPEVVSLAERYEDVYASVGVHPLDCKSVVPDIEVVRALADHRKVIAIGETGLDYYYATTEGALAVQRQSFINHLELAAELELPVVVHVRDAWEDALEFIREYGHKESSGVLHCFTGSLEMAKTALDLNYYISISGIVTFRNASALRDVVEYLPMDRLLIETDSPYLTPVPNRGKSNEPRFVADVARFIAELKGITTEEVGKKTSGNFYRLFHRAV